jgi:Tfp pilus assembly protein PilF
MTSLSDLAKNPAGLDDWAPLPRLIEIGLYAAHYGQPAKAKSLFESLLDASPDFEQARIGLALVSLVTDQFEQAEKGLREVLSRNPRHAGAQVFLGLSMALSGRLDEAGPVLEQAAQLGGPAAELARQLKG